jgi:hypothetical protein
MDSNLKKKKIKPKQNDEIMRQHVVDSIVLDNILNKKVIPFPDLEAERRRKLIKILIEQAESLDW